MKGSRLVWRGPWGGWQAGWCGVRQARFWLRTARAQPIARWHARPPGVVMDADARARLREPRAVRGRKAVGSSRGSIDARLAALWERAVLREVGAAVERKPIVVERL